MATKVGPKIKAKFEAYKNSPLNFAIPENTPATNPL